MPGFPGYLLNTAQALCTLLTCLIFKEKTVVYFQQTMKGLPTNFNTWKVLHFYLVRLKLTFNSYIVYGVMVVLWLQAA